MKRFVVTALFASCVFSASLSAQYYGDRYYQDRYYQGNEGDYRSGGYQDYRSAFYLQLQSDLARAAESNYLSGWELDRFRHASEEIREFQQKWARGRIDVDELDDAIAATQRVVNLPDLDYRDRAAINRDLIRMRNFRRRMSNREDYDGDDRGYYRRY